LVFLQVFVFVVDRIKRHGQVLVMLVVLAWKIRYHIDNHLLHRHPHYNIDQRDLIVNVRYVDQDVVMPDRVEVKHDQDVVMLVRLNLNHLQIR
jgi:hypothetical protein